MKLDDVIEKIVRIIRKIEQCNWTKDNGWECSKECPVRDIEDCSQGIRYMNENNFQKYTESVVKQFFKEHPDEAGKSTDEETATENQKEITIEDVVDYLNTMFKKYHTLCRKTHCDKCNLSSDNSNELCSFLNTLKDDVEERKLEETDKILKSVNLKLYPDPKDTVASFIQDKIKDTESENEKCKYQKILEKING